MKSFSDYYKELRELSITEVVGEFCQVRGRKCRCPFHDDHHASLVLFPDTQTWKCMACGESGSTIDFVMKHENLDFRGACEWLGSRYNIEVPKAQTKDEKRRTKDEGRKTKTSRLKQEMDKIQQIMERQNRKHNGTVIQRSETTKNLSCLNGSPSRDPSSPSGRLDDIICFEYEIAQSFVSSDNSFCQCMKVLFDEATVERVTCEYLLGEYEYKGHEDCVLFPSIDANFEVRDMKIQWYEARRESPRFFHCDKEIIAWWGGLDGVKEKLPTGLHIDRDCLFGEHLLTKYPDRTVVLVESPKNACLGSALCPDMVWVATGNKTQLKPRVLEALRGRDVLVIPDRDAIDDWARVISGLGSLANFRMSGMNEVLEQGDNEKCDVADIIISNLTPALSEGEGEPSGSCHSEEQRDEESLLQE